jgi:acylphosphatase
VYTGRVQGVGFRFTAVEVARRHHVAGTVRNCSDGSVEIVVQGEADEVQDFLAALARRMEGYIDGQRTEDAAPSNVQGFHIIR